MTVERKMRARNPMWLRAQNAYHWQSMHYIPESNGVPFTYRFALLVSRPPFRHIYIGTGMRARSAHIPAWNCTRAPALTDRDCQPASTRSRLVVVCGGYSDRRSSTTACLGPLCNPPRG